MASQRDGPVFLASKPRSRDGAEPSAITAESDHDLGLCCWPHLDLGALGCMVREVAGPRQVLTEPVPGRSVNGRRAEEGEGRGTTTTTRWAERPPVQTRSPTATIASATVRRLALLLRA
jgi:hypothetical protein